MSDDVVIYCVAVRDLKHPTAGATKEPCAFCREPVWLSKATRETTIKRHGLVEAVRLSCRGCAEMRITPKTKFMPMSKEQLREAAEHLRRRKR